MRVFAQDGTIVSSSAKSEKGRPGTPDEDILRLFRADKEPGAEISERRVVRTSRNARGEVVYTLARPIVNHPECSTAACHDHPASDRVLGVLDVQRSLSTVEKIERGARAEFLVATLVVGLLVAGGVVAFVQRTIRGPVLRLKRAADRVAAGNLSATLSIERDNELGDLARSFNTMTGELKKSQEELSQWSSDLEARVERKADQVAALQEQRQHLDKMASLGRLAAVMAHELNNPLGGILTYAKLVQRKLASSGLRPELSDELSRYLGLLQSESTRCGELVRNLLSFAGRGSQSVAEFDVNELVDRIGLLVRPHAAQKERVALDFGRLASDSSLSVGPLARLSVWARCGRVEEGVGRGSESRMRVLRRTESLEAGSEGPFDVAIVDVKMPDMDGVELQGHIKAIDETLQIIMLTAFAAVDTAVPSPTRSSRASSSDTRRDRSRERSSCAKGSSRRPMAGPSFSTRSQP